MLYRTRLLLPTSASTATTLISSDPTLASVATPLRERDRTGTWGQAGFHHPSTQMDFPQSISGSKCPPDTPYPLCTPTW